ncbi:tetratricopeptide repeat-containing sensor histidine kinase [Flavobacterium sp. XGLA_31]|uniref:tetratricopeptide repeat-containing sensor histidine kinase n=1 Tax=Flavobacterium sp. XGLA_31 TaxID=3447666 RepID=UPI003F3080B7
MSRKIVHILIVLSVISYLGCTSKPTVKYVDTKNDSVKKYIDLALNDTLDLEKRIKYNDRAFSFLDLTKNDSLIRSYIITIASNYLTNNDFNKYKKVNEIYFQKIIQTKDTLGFAGYYRYKGSYFRKKALFDSAFYYFNKSEKIYKKLKNDEGLAHIYSNISAVQYKIDDYLGAELNTKKAYQYFNKKKDNKRIVECLIRLGNIYHDLKQYEKAIETMKKALSIIKSHKLPNLSNFNLVGTCINDIGNVYREKENYKTAIYYFELALKDKNLINEDPELFSYLINNLGYCRLMTNNNKNLPKLFYVSEKIFHKIGVKNECAVSNIYLSQYYLKKENIIKAISHAEKALKLAKEAKAPYYYLTALSNAGAIDAQKAPLYIQEYHKMNDSLLFVERNARNQYYKIQFETDQINQEKEKAVHQKWKIAVLLSLLVLIIILSFIIHHQRTKQKELNLLSEQQKADEKIYNLMLTQKAKEEEARQIEKRRIALELHDGIMNKLVSTRLNLSVLSQKTDKETIAKCLKYIEDIYNIEQNIRGVAHELNQDTFNEEDSFIKLLEDFVTEQNNYNETRYELELDPDIDWNNISSELKMHLYRIIQEASHNINKHAQATKAVITFTVDEPNICMSVTDDGQGFDTTLTPKGIGIQNMKVRVKSLHGKFSINSTTGFGTSINIAIPT